MLSINSCLPETVEIPSQCHYYEQVEWENQYFNYEGYYDNQVVIANQFKTKTENCSVDSLNVIRKDSIFEIRYFANYPCEESRYINSNKNKARFKFKPEKAITYYFRNYKLDGTYIEYALKVEEEYLKKQFI